MKGPHQPLHSPHVLPSLADAPPARILFSHALFVSRCVVGWLHGNTQSLVAPHIESFDFFLEDGLSEAVKDMPPQVMQVRKYIVSSLLFVSTSWYARGKNAINEKSSWAVTSVDMSTERFVELVAATAIHTPIVFEPRSSRNFELSSHPLFPLRNFIWCIDVYNADVCDAEHQLGEGGPLLKLWVEGVTVGYPGKKNEEATNAKLTPRECRERGLTYHGALLVDLCYQVFSALLSIYCC